MSDALSAIHKALADFDETPTGYATALRHDFERLIVEILHSRGWTQRVLAERLGKPESFVSRLIHGKSNCELQTIGAVMHALGVKPALVRSDNITQKTLGSDWTVIHGKIEGSISHYSQEQVITASSNRESGSGIAHSVIRQPKHRRARGYSDSGTFVFPRNTGYSEQPLRGVPRGDLYRTRPGNGRKIG